MRGDFDAPGLLSLGGGGGAIIGGILRRETRFLSVIIFAGVIGGAYPCGTEQREAGKEIEERHEPDDRAEGGTRGRFDQLR